MALSVDMVERSGMIPDEPVVPNVAHIPESVQREQWKRMFHFGDGDTLAFADADQRRSLEALADRSADPEHTRKRIALAYYYSAKSRDDIGFTYDHIDQVIRTFSGGEEKSVEDAYKDLAELYGNREPDNAVWAATKAGLIGAGKLWLRGAAFLNKIIAEGTVYRMRADMLANRVESEEVDRMFTDPEELGETVSKPALNYYKSKTQQAEQNAIRDMNIPEDWGTNSDGVLDWFRNAGLSTLSSLPQLGVQIVWTAATGSLGAFELYAADAYYNIEEAMPDASEEKKLAYASSVGLIVSLSEKVTFGLIKGKPVKDAVQYSLGRMFAEAGIDLLKEVGSEGVEQLGTNAADILSGMRGDTKGWTTERYLKELFKDVPESGISAAVPGYGFGLIGRNNTRKNYLKKAQAREQIIQTVEKRKDELEAKEDLSDGERSELKTLNTVLDSGKLQDIDRQAEKIAVQETVKQLASSDKTEYAEDATAEAQQTAAAEVQRLQLKQMMPHNPEDTEQAVLQEAGAYGVPIQTTRAWTDEQVQILIERAGIPQDIAPGDRQKFIDRIKMKQEAIWNPDGTITINTAVVRPSRVPFVVAHELLVHEGLARVFNPSAKKELMDTIWKDFGETDLMKSIVRRYGLRRSRTDEVGEVYQEEMTDPERREAAEEFLAHLGETNGVPLETIYTQNQDEIDAWASSKKLQGSREHLTREWMYETGYRPERPGWLRQLISAIRVWLRQHGFTKLVSTLSDQDIQYILAKAAKADLSKRRARNGEAARADFRKNRAAASIPKGGSRLSIADRDRTLQALEGVDLRQELKRVWEAKLKTGEYRMKDPAHQELAISGALKFFEMFARKEITLSDGRIVYFMPDSRSFERTDDVTAWCEYCFHAVTSSGSRKFAKGYRERLYNPDKHKNLHNIDTIIRDEKTFAAFHEDPQDDAIIFTGTTSDGQTVEIITKLDKYGNINADLVEVTALISGKNKVVPPPKPLTEVVEAVANRHQEAGYLPSTKDNLPSTAENASGEFENSSRNSISPDAEYLSAVEQGDMEAAQRMVEEAARAKGYSADDDWRLGHRAPNSRLVAEDPDGPTQRITDWKKVVPEDYFDHPDWYTSSPEERESFFALKRALDLYEQRKAEGRGREKYVGLRVYRAVDKTVNSKESEFRNGDWVTPSKTYAEMEGEGNPDGSRIIMHWVPLEHLYWNGDSIAELGYDDGKNYAYADTKNNRKLLDPVTYDDEGIVIPLSKRFNKRSDDVRSSLINLELTEDERSLVNIMKVLVSGQFDPDFDYAQRVKDVYGLEVSAEDAKFAAMVALREKKADAQRAAREKAYAYFRSNNPLFEFIDDFAGGFHDFHIVPVNGKGEKFTGTFISPEYVKWSEKRPHGKNESDKQYQNYLQKREEALKRAKGYNSADLAEAYARKTGLDTVTVEQEIVELFRDLKKPDILSAWKSYKDENLGMSRQEQEMLKKSQEDYFRNMAEDAAMEVLEAGQPVITEDWIKQNRDVFEVLYEQLTGKKEAPYKLSKSDMESLNAAIVQDHGAGSVYFAARKEAREASRQEFEKRLAEFRQAVQAREVNAMNLQRELVDFIRKNLPGDLHGKYEKRIISLMKLKTDYKREEVFQNILSDMLEDSLNSKRHDLIKRITDMLERNKTKRTDKNVPYSPMGDRQQVLDRIFKIVRMSEGTVALSRGVHAERLEAIEKTLEGYSDDQDRAEEQIKLQQEKKEIERDLFYLEHYGNLSHKEIEEIDNSMKMLEKFIRKGRDEFKSRLDERAQRTRVLRESLRMEMSRGSLSVPHKDSLDIRENKLYRYALNNLSLSQQVRMFSRQEDDLKFHDSTHGKILAMIEDSTQKEATFIRKGQQRLDEVYTKLGIKNKIVLGKFLSSLEQEQDTGIDIPVYVTVKKSARDPEITYTSEAAGRQKLTGSFNVEHIRHLNELLEEGLQITSILRTGSLENYRAIAEEIRSDLGVPLEGGFTICLENDGSFRVLTGNESGGTTDHHFGRHQMTATMQQRMAEENALFPIDQYARASIRARVEEYDAGMDTSYKPDTGDDIDNAALAAAEKSERGDRVKAPHVMLLAANPQNMVEGRKRLKISPAAAVQLLLEWEQDNYKLNFDFYGFTEEKIAALKSWLEINHSGALKLGYALRDLVFEQRGELDAAVFEKYGVHLPETKNFWYGDFSSNMADQIRDAGYGNPVGGLTVSANFLTGRKFHLQKPGTKTSFMNLFMMRQLETAHFIAYSQTIRDIRAIYNSSEVQNIMIREFGIDALLEWKKGLEQLASGGEISNFKTLQALANYIHEIFYPANVALNLKSVCSQIAGGTAYALYVPPAQLLKRLPFNRNNKKYRDFLETVMKSDYFLNRMNGSGFDPYMNTFLNPYSKKKVTPIKDSIIQKSMAPTLWGDKVSSTTFGYAAYSYFYDQAIKNGKTVAEAKQYALQMWERATDETQQSGYTKDRNKFNTNPGILRALTAYMTSPMQQFGLELSSILRACKDPTKKNLTEAGRRILINHFVSTTIFNLIASAFRHGFNFGDYLEDWEDYVRGWILGQMDSLFLVGTVLTETFNLLTGNGLFNDEKSLLPMKENFVRDFRKIKSDITGRSEVDWLDYLQASGDVMMSAGPAPSRLFGGALYITSREIRRARRWFEGDEDKERKKKKAAR